ncbi:MAG: coiled-coil domain-containing protein [Candidatus Hodarchaeales archaeon]
MTNSVIEDYIDDINKHKQKTIEIAYEKSKKVRQSIKKHCEKVQEGSKRLIEETDALLTEEGIKKITKKGKIYFRSLKAFNTLVHYVNDQFKDFKVPNPKKELTYVDLSLFIRSLSKVLNDVAKEQKTADSIMGIDFMLKKRSVYVPIGKLNSELRKIRELQKQEYTVVKAIEDLNHIARDIEELENKILKTKEGLTKLRQERESLLSLIEKFEKKRTELLAKPVIKNSKERGIRMTELEIEMGRHLNSFKKIFKKYAREVQRGSISGDFGLVNAAISYEKDPVKQYLKEKEGQEEIIALLEELIEIGASGLKLKQKNITNLKQELKIIKDGKLNNKKAEWIKLAMLKKQDEQSDEYQRVNGELKEIESKIEELRTKLQEKDEEISLREKELKQFFDSLEERKQRAKDLRDEVLLEQE